MVLFLTLRDSDEYPARRRGFGGFDNGLTIRYTGAAEKTAPVSKTEAASNGELRSAIRANVSPMFLRVSSPVVGAAGLFLLVLHSL